MRKTSYVYQGKIVKIEHLTRPLNVRKVGDELVSDEEDLGWHMTTNYFAHQKFPLGMEKPDPMPKVGDKVEIVVRFPDPPPAPPAPAPAGGAPVPPEPDVVVHIPLKGDANVA